MGEGLTTHTIYSRHAGPTICVMPMLAGRGASAQHDSINQKRSTGSLTLFVCTLLREEKEIARST